MIVLLSFLVGVGVGAALTYHLAQVSELRRKAGQQDREPRG